MFFSTQRKHRDLFGIVLRTQLKKSSTKLLIISGLICVLYRCNANISVLMTISYEWSNNMSFLFIWSFGMNESLFIRVMEFFICIKTLLLSQICALHLLAATPPQLHLITYHWRKLLSEPIMTCNVSRWNL